MVVHENQKWLDGSIEENLNLCIVTSIMKRQRRKEPLGKMLIKEMLRQKKTALGKKRPGKRNAQTEGMPRQGMPRPKKYTGKRDAQRQRGSGRRNAQARNVQTEEILRQKGCPGKRDAQRQRECPGERDAQAKEMTTVALLAIHRSSNLPWLY